MDFVKIVENYLLKIWMIKMSEGPEIRGIYCDYCKNDCEECPWRVEENEI